MGVGGLPDTDVVLMNFLIRVSSRDMADLYFTPDLLLLNTLFHGSQVSRGVSPAALQRRQKKNRQRKEES